MRSQFLQYLCGIFGADVAEYMRMAANHFVVNGFHYVGDSEAPLFAGDFRMKNHLQEQVAHFFGKFRVVAGIERVENFVNFFNQVGAQGGVSLFAVPRTTLWRAKTLLHGDEFFKPLAGRQSGGAAGILAAGGGDIFCACALFLSGKASGSRRTWVSRAFHFTASGKF